MALRAVILASFLARFCCGSVRFATQGKATLLTAGRGRAEGCPPDVSEEEMGPWRRATQLAAGVPPQANLCVEGRQVPQLYVLGEPKTATTSFSWDLMSAGIETLGVQLREGRPDKPKGYCFKEMHYFDGVMNWDHVHEEGSSDYATEKQKWLDLFDSCGGERRVLADFTPSNLLMTSRPWPALYEGTRKWEKPGINLPNLLPAIYGDAKSRLVFVVMLREPLALFQSLWYCCMGGGEKTSERFREALALHLDKADGNVTNAEGWVWRLLFARHIEGWLEHFEPNQFVVVPYRQYVAGDKDAVCRELSLKLGFAMHCDSAGAAPSHRYNDPGTQGPKHPPLEEDVTPELRRRFDEFYAPERVKLAQVLAGAEADGAVLANYDGPPDSALGVAQWLEDGW